MVLLTAQGADDRWTYDPVSGPVRSIGTIDGFGSIFVNGIEFETGAAQISRDGQVVSEDSLRLGMVVMVAVRMTPPVTIPAMAVVTIPEVVVDRGISV